MDKLEKSKLVTVNIYQKLAMITGEIGVMEKGGRNQEQRYDFIEYAAIAGRIRTLFSKHGVIIVPKVKSQQRLEITSKHGARGIHAIVTMEFDIVNADQPDDRFTVTWEAEAADYGDKATNKAITAALKYYIMRQFNISEKGEDADEHTPAPIEAVNILLPPVPQAGSFVTEAQVKLLLARSRDASGLTDRQDIYDWFLEHFGVMPNEILRNDIDMVLQTIQIEAGGYE